MDASRIEALLVQLREGKLSIPDAMDKLRNLPYDDLGFARVDGHRALRRGFPEVVYCPGKTTNRIVQILRKLSDDHTLVLATRATPAVYSKVKRTLRGKAVAYFAAARIIAVGLPPRKGTGHVIVVSAGTSDIPVAEEAAVTAELMGAKVTRLFDVGVAGVHRILDHRGMLETARVIVVVAGMEGAFPSVVAGLVSVPVIAVPTSVGYGASFGGMAALLAMMNACAPGVAVVNIDNGFGAGDMAARINHGSRPRG